MGTVSAGVQYVKRLKIFETEVPFQSFVDIPEDAPDQRKTNLEFTINIESFGDMRDNINSFSLDKHGFMVKQEPLPFSSEFFTRREEVEKLYFPELERIIGEVCGEVEKVHFFDWRVCPPAELTMPNAATDRIATEQLRSSKISNSTGVIDLYDPTAWLLPANRVHIGRCLLTSAMFCCLVVADSAAPRPEPGCSSPQSFVAFPTRGRAASSGACTNTKVSWYHKSALYLPSAMANSRVLSFWRPISHPVEDYPLAVCEASSVSQDDLLECDHIRKKYIGSTVFLTHKDGYKWRYLSDHRPDEILVMKMFDSDAGVARRKYSGLLLLRTGEELTMADCPHVSFKNPRASENSQPRQSIEVRALVFSSLKE